MVHSQALSLDQEDMPKEEKSSCTNGSTLRQAQVVQSQGKPYASPTESAARLMKIKHRLKELMMAVDEFEGAETSQSVEGAQKSTTNRDIVLVSLKASSTLLWDPKMLPELPPIQDLPIRLLPIAQSIMSACM